MKKIVYLFIVGILLLSLLACGSEIRQEPESKQDPENGTLDQIEKTSSETETSGTEKTSSGAKDSLVHELGIQVTGEDGQHIVFRLNDSPAANALYEQLPLTIAVEDYSHNEKIFYPPNELNTNDTPLARGSSGTLAYYAPWGDVVLFYGEFDGAGGLYELGEAVSGADRIESLSGEIQLDIVNGAYGKSSLSHK